jgi:type I restriction-modification system DNA methylase subunit
LKLILIYDYPVNRIKQFVSVQMGSETKEADIIVYADDACEKTYILIECKKEEVNDQEFNKAVDQAYSYCVAEGGKYIWTTSRIKNEYYEVPTERPKSRIAIPDIPQFGTDKLAPYKYVKGGEDPNNTKQKFFELEIVKENELTRIFTQAHQALWGGFRKPDKAFDEFSKLLFCKLWDERKPRKIGEPYEFQIWKDETPQTLFDRVGKLYEIGKKIDKDKNIFEHAINLRPEEVQNVVTYLQRINLSKTDLDSKGRAFETFMGDHFRGDYGAYFTPRAIVNFIVDSLPIQHTSKVLDTSCGSGGFLLHALDKIRTQANEYYPKDSNEHYRHWHDFAENNLFGIELEESIARTAKMNMIIHDDGHTNVIQSDGLLSDKIMQEKSGNKHFTYNSFDFIITNPPFGSIVKQSMNAYLGLYKLGKKDSDWLNIKSTLETIIRESQSTEVLFLEQCHHFLTEHGYLAIVIPDGILTNSSLQYVRDSLEEKYRIVAVVSMPQTAFSATGAGVKSSVLFLRKHKQQQTDKIENQKEKLKEQVKIDTKYVETIEKWEKEKQTSIKKLEHDAKKNNPTATKQEITEIIKLPKSAIQTSFIDRVNLLKEELTEKYFIEKQKVLDDYPIFMAIAEDIGYDATGRATANNELIEISEELAKFINHINNTEK